MPKNDAEAEKVALLASQGLSQKGIANLLRLSQPTVSRRLTEARNSRILETSCTLSKARVRELTEEIYAANLQKRLEALSRDKGSNLLDVVVLNNGSTGRAKTNQERESRLEHFTELAASYLRTEVFPEAERIGVTWGYTLRMLVKHLQQQRSRFSRFRRLRFIPVCGDPPDVSFDPLRSSSLLAAQLTATLCGQSKAELSLAGVAACIPSDLAEAEITIMHRFFKSISGYGQIFGIGGERGIVDEIDGLLTSVGTTSHLHDPWYHLPDGPDRHRRLEATSLGNIAGNFLPKDGIPPEDAKFIEHVNHRWTGIRLAHLIGCATRAVEERNVGVVVVALGAEKAGVIIECLTRDIINRLVIDQELAAALSERLPG